MTTNVTYDQQMFTFISKLSAMAKSAVKKVRKTVTRGSTQTAFATFTQVSVAGSGGPPMYREIYHTYSDDVDPLPPYVEVAHEDVNDFTETPAVYKEPKEEKTTDSRFYLTESTRIRISIGVIKKSSGWYQQRRREMRIARPRRCAVTVCAPTVKLRQPSHICLPNDAGSVCSRSNAVRLRQDDTAIDDDGKFLPKMAGKPMPDSPVPDATELPLISPPLPSSPNVKPTNTPKAFKHKLIQRLLQLRADFASKPKPRTDAEKRPSRAVLDLDALSFAESFARSEPQDDRPYVVTYGRQSFIYDRADPLCPEEKVDMPLPEGDEVAIRLDSNGDVKAASLPALVQLLTSHHVIPLDEICETLFLFFRLFSSARKLFAALRARWDQRAPDTGVELTAQQQRVWAIHICYIRNCLAQLILTWLDEYWRPTTDGSILAQLRVFVQRRFKNAGLVQGFTALVIDALDRAAHKENVSRAQRAREIERQGAPPDASPLQLVLRPEDDYCMNLAVFESTLGRERFAAQITALAHKHFRALDPEVAVARWVTSEPTFFQIQKLEEALLMWVAQSIVELRAREGRVTMIEFWLDVASICVNLRNFSSGSAIFGGLVLSPVERLSLTILEVGISSKEQYRQLNRLFDGTNNYALYRRTLAANNLPAVPLSRVRVRVSHPRRARLDVPTARDACSSSARGSVPWLSSRARAARGGGAAGRDPPQHPAVLHAQRRDARERGHDPAHARPAAALRRAVWVGGGGFTDAPEGEAERDAIMRGHYSALQIITANLLRGSMTYRGLFPPIFVRLRRLGMRALDGLHASPMSLHQQASPTEPSPMPAQARGRAVTGATPPSALNLQRHLRRPRVPSLPSNTITSTARFGVAELIGFGAAEIAAETFVFSCCSGVRETAGSGLAELAAQTASFRIGLSWVRLPDREITGDQTSVVLPLSIRLGGKAGTPARRCPPITVFAYTHLRAFTGFPEYCAGVSAHAPALERLTILTGVAYPHEEFAPGLFRANVGPRVRNLTVRGAEKYMEMDLQGILPPQSIGFLVHAFPNTTHLEICLDGERKTSDYRDALVTLHDLEYLRMHRVISIRAPYESAPAAVIFPAEQYAAKINETLSPFLPQLRQVRMSLFGTDYDWEYCLSRAEYRFCRERGGTKLVLVPK
ncbi:hypothetical protein C8R47DRAFT_1203339 [Mycena vitilis]|nr:hypothetical protein C8R47DRAFT_1203339 [Mycena vitilis]